ncbi:MAG TPA: ABC transporter permease [Thermomicrobiales bacterium]|jgi:NitT/TauT family transport system permease protein
MSAFDASSGERGKLAAETGHIPTESAMRREARSSRAHQRSAALGWLLVPLSLLLGLLGWQWLVTARNIPAFILPPPGRVATRFLSALADGTWWANTSVTLIESLLGFALGFAVATVLGYLLAHLPLLERLVSPYIAASQALPIVAIAPILLLWLGFGLLPKVIVAAIVVFFPMLINTIGGLRRIDPSLREVALVYGASRWQMFRYVEVPLALPTILGGTRIGFTLAVTGATVAEFMGADRGLGLLLNVSKGLFDTPLLFVALLTLVTIAMLAYGLVALLERLIVRW